MGIVFFLSLALSVSSTAGDYRQKLKELEEKLRATRAKITKLETREKDLKRQLRLLEEEQQTLQSMIQLTRHEEARARRRLSVLNRKIEEGQRRLGEWLEALKISGRYAVTEKLSASSDPVLQVVVSKMTEIAARNLQQYRTEVRQLQRWRRDREKALQTIRTLRRRLEQDQKELVRVEQKRKALLKKVKRQKKQEKTKEQEILEAKKKLEALLRELTQKSQQRRKQQGIPTQKLTRGLLSWPVQGQVIARFGMMKDPKYGTKVKNNGIDILSAPGSEIRAAADGEVVFAGPFLSYRNMVILDHHGFLTIYAYLETLRVQVGDQVQRGTPIGRLGASQPILHFEVRKEGKAVDPLRYLKSP